MGRVVRRTLGLVLAALATPALALAAPPAAGGGDDGDRVRAIERRVIAIVRREESVSGAVRSAESPKQVEVAISTDVLFAFDSADLTPAAAQILQDTANGVREEASGAVAVHGHTDSIGDPAYNQSLSERRAAAVRDALVPAVGRGDLTYEVAGFGETQPVAPNENPDGSDNPEGRARNRRVTITFPKGAPAGS
jgi:outer membrane protein OmpA-like peptidoglycan-associated protein